MIEINLLPSVGKKKATRRKSVDFSAIAEIAIRTLRVIDASMHFPRFESALSRRSAGAYVMRLATTIGGGARSVW